eukprot:304717_1
MNVNVLTPDGKCDDELLVEKAAFVITTSFCVRGDEIHRSLDEDLIISIDDKGFVFADLKIYYGKSRTIIMVMVRPSHYSQVSRDVAKEWKRLAKQLPQLIFDDDNNNNILKLIFMVDKYYHV